MGNSSLMLCNNAASIGIAKNTKQQVISSRCDKTNPFLLAATPLLMFITQIQNCETTPDIEKLHTQIITEVKRFIIKLRKINFSTLLIDCATYCLCAALDETILAKPWGTQSKWVQSSLLIIFKGESWGGERFYVITHALSREPRKNIYVLELIYTLLSLGFEGRYFGKAHILRDDIRNRLFQKIQSSRGKIEKALSLHWKDAQALNARRNKRNLLKRVILISVSFLCCIGMYYNICTYKKVNPILKKINTIAHESPITAYSILLGRSIFPKRKTDD